MQHQQLNDDGQAVREMDKDYRTAAIGDLVELIADMLVQLVRHNDALDVQDAPLTRFHSRSPPAISVGEYLERITRYSSLEASCLLATVYYIDLLAQMLPGFSISGLTVHRFLITASTVASKGLCDAFCTNTHYAKVGGVSTRELHILELELLTRLQWRIIPRPELLHDYYLRLVERHPKYRLRQVSIRPDPMNDE